MKAARAGHLCTVQFLISKGALLTHFDEIKYTLPYFCGGSTFLVCDLKALKCYVSFFIIFFQFDFNICEKTNISFSEKFVLKIIVHL